MTATPPGLDDAQIERLSELLERRAVPFRGFNIEALDGFLSAIAVSPVDVPAEEWMPVVWGGREPRWDGEEERGQVHGLLAAHLAMCIARARHEGGELPEQLAPLMWLPSEEDDGLDGDEPEVGRDWALGFFEGVALRGDGWDRWLDRHEWIGGILDDLELLASDGASGDDPDASPGYRERLEIVLEIPGMLADLYRDRPPRH